MLYQHMCRSPHTCEILFLEFLPPSFWWEKWSCCRPILYEGLDHENNYPSDSMMWLSPKLDGNTTLLARAKQDRNDWIFQLNVELCSISPGNGLYHHHHHHHHHHHRHHHQPIHSVVFRAATNYPNLCLSWAYLINEGPTKSAWLTYRSHLFFSMLLSISLSFSFRLVSSEVPFWWLFVVLSSKHVLAMSIVVSWW